MPATLVKRCRACNEKHTFFLPGDELSVPEKRFIYHCHAVGRRARLLIAARDWWMTVKEKPEDAIEVKEVG